MHDATARSSPAVQGIPEVTVAAADSPRTSSREGARLEAPAKEPGQLARAAHQQCGAGRVNSAALRKDRHAGESAARSPLLWAAGRCECCAATPP